VSLSVPALGGEAVTDRAAVARVVAMLVADEAATALTGVTVTADGGVWMAP
jgi:hypothetical protein